MKKEIKIPPSNDERGYTNSELVQILKDNPDIKEDKFWDALTGVTCMMNEDGEALIYHCDVNLAVDCGIKNINVNSWEWD